MGREQEGTKMISAIQKLLRELGNEAEAHRRDCQAQSQTTITVDNPDAPTSSLSFLDRQP